jgi:hypothetical protein
VGFKELLEILSKIPDILNVGRLVFYSAAGFFAFYPVVMIYRTLAKKELMPFFEHLMETAPIGNAVDYVLIYLGSLIVGFLIASVGFAAVIYPNSVKVKFQLDSLGEYTNSYPFIYPRLCNDESKKGYDDWLITEFYRYVEIVTYIPMGLLLGIVFLIVYTIIYLFRYSVVKPFTGSAEGYVFLIFLSVLLGFLWFFAWKEFWMPKVIEPTIYFHSKAKFLLIHGLEDYQKRCAEKPQKEKDAKSK